MSMRISFRKIRKEDEKFLYRLYAGTRSDEMMLTGWSDRQKDEFLKQQFQAQHRFYRDQFAGARFDLILLGSTPIGRLYVDYRPDEIRLIDIALLPDYRGRGIGSHLISNLLLEAAAEDKKVRIHVEKFNPALRLYRRMGFSVIGDKEVYYLMEWSPE